MIDDKKEAILLTDQHKNKITMDKNGITLDSAKDILLNAAANVKINSKTNTSIDAKSKLSMAGMNIEATASVGFTAKGSAKAELSASGQTVIKGAMVMIN
ncbi:MAG: hypothetical protein LIP01_14285 [Tannerellaceae bacterium]|nr:hypothetical protein [Tannerellaceae bacterium]